MLTGTHNSYHKSSLFYQYQHRELESQLDAGVRQLELDIHLMENYDVTYHLQLIDDKTNCYCLSECLRRIYQWSLINPGHHPIFLFLEIKQKFYEDFFTPVLGGVQCRHLQAIKDQLLQVFQMSSFIPVKQVQGNYTSVSDALKRQRRNELNGDYSYNNYGWPPLNQSLGKILPIFLDDAYDSAVNIYNTCEPLLNFFFVAQKYLDRPYASIICASSSPKNEQNLIDSTANGLITRVLLGDSDYDVLNKYKRTLDYDVNIISTDSLQCNNTQLCQIVADTFPPTAPVLCGRKAAPKFCNRTVSAFL